MATKSAGIPEKGQVTRDIKDKLISKFSCVKKCDHRKGNVGEIRERTIVGKNWEVVHVITRPK